MMDAKNTKNSVHIVPSLFTLCLSFFILAGIFLSIYLYGFSITGNNRLGC